ncbi:similar to Saccharomyces cerevisiae YMR316W DIA1 Protein of unknown function, involved in invasive and pseudohyphal growth [Maudiozyma saulgeensis]|uniref:Uncharacterized protein n=1 Tax=Maudiozyma saulgeensis TaxID=1789683 RepID=A0A1X7R431_9SACH|nr:similar to Saccharomyces cerevisiae YMR316W DIA1 Protein of unknown function, involved in invasive and pseudohyphal growth [Kazachstania saulgeensis]
MGLFRKLAVKLMDDDRRLRVEKKNDKHIPEFLHFNIERHMPIVDVPTRRGYLIFPSIQSFDRFKTNRGSDINNIDENGMGIPLFLIERQLLTHGMTMLDTELTYKIYKYEIKKLDEVPPYGDFEIIAQNANFKVYKYVYSKIYKSSKLSQTALQFVVNEDKENASYMLHKREFRDMDTCVMNQNFRWHVRYSPLENDHYKLALLNPREISLTDSPSVKLQKKKENLTKIDPYDAVIGHYTSEDKDILPGVIEKDADFVVGEQGSEANLGLSNVPELTQTFACQALVLHVIERQKERKNRRNRHRNRLMFDTQMYGTAGGTF